jgi:hypothetical protein
MILPILLAAVLSQAPTQAADGSINSVTVRVVDDRCQPMPGAVVTLRPHVTRFRPPKGVEPVSCITGTSGMATCGPVLQGSWEIAASLAGFYETRIGPVSVSMYGGLSVTLSLTYDWSDHGPTFEGAPIVVPAPSPSPVPTTPRPR